MSRLVVRWTDGFCNIKADRIVEEDGFIRAYNSDTLVAIFDLGSINMLWLSEETKKE